MSETPAQGQEQNAPAEAPAEATQGQDQSNEGKTLTWEEHVAENKRIAAKEKKEGRAAEQNDLLKKSGYDSVDALLEAARTQREAEDLTQTEVEKRDQEIQARDESIQEKDETIASLTRQVRRSSFIENIGLPNPRAAWGYVLDGTVEVEWDDNHKPSNLDAVRKALKNEDAGLFGNGSADGGRRGGSSGAPQNLHGGDLIKHAYENSK